MIPPLILSAISGAGILVAVFFFVYNFFRDSRSERKVSDHETEKENVTELRRLLRVNEAFNAERTIDCKLLSHMFPPIHYYFTLQRL